MSVDVIRPLNCNNGDWFVVKNDNHQVQSGDPQTVVDCMMCTTYPNIGVRIPVEETIYKGRKVCKVELGACPHRCTWNTTVFP